LCYLEGTWSYLELHGLRLPANGDDWVIHHTLVSAPAQPLPAFTSVQRPCLLYLVRRDIYPWVELAGFKFDTPVGNELKRFITFGIGVHHAGRGGGGSSTQRKGSGRFGGGFKALSNFVLFVSSY
jgi:hypothetical protein